MSSQPMAHAARYQRICAKYFGKVNSSILDSPIRMEEECFGEWMLYYRSLKGWHGVAKGRLPDHFYAHSRHDSCRPLTRDLHSSGLQVRGNSWRPIGLFAGNKGLLYLSSYHQISLLPNPNRLS